MTPEQKRDLNRVATGRHITPERLAEFHALGYIRTDMYGSPQFKHDGLQALHAIQAEANP